MVMKYFTLMNCANDFGMYVLLIYEYSNLLGAQPYRHGLLPDRGRHVYEPVWTCGLVSVTARVNPNTAQTAA